MNAIVPVEQRIKGLRDLMGKYKGQMALALPKYLSVDRVLRLALTCVQKNPALADCTPMSVIGGIFESAQLGLVLDGVLGEGYLIPFKNRAQFIPGYQGLLKLARNSGEVKCVSAECVYEKDAFKYRYGLIPDLTHVPADGLRGDLTHVYAIAWLKSGGVQFKVLSRQEVERHRARSRAANSGPWVTDYDAMALKTALRVLCKLLPRSPELAKAVAMDEAAERGTEVRSEVEQNVDPGADFVALDDDPLAQLSDSKPGKSSLEQAMLDKELKKEAAATK